MGNDKHLGKAIPLGDFCLQAVYYYYCIISVHIMNWFTW